MADHYYTSHPSAKHDRTEFEVTLRGYTLRLVTDAGVFSKKGIDAGSRLLIEQLQFQPGARIADVGCGYGPIGLFAAKLLDQGHVTMVDINERALSLAMENAKRNHIEHVRILRSDGLQQLADQTFDAIVTNPPIRAGKQIVFNIYEQAAERLVEGGELWVVIQKKQGAPSTFAKLKELFTQVEEVCKDKGYRVYRAKK